jgi:hypothetical protein
MRVHRPDVKRFMLLTLLGAGLGIGSGGIVMSAKSLVVKTQSGCVGVSCMSWADCLTIGSPYCVCNIPDGSLGTCIDENIPC